MPVPVQEEVVAVLERHARDVLCREAIEKAWATVKQGYPALAWFRRKSTARALMWEHSVQGVIDVLSSDGHIKAVRHYDTVSFIMDDAVLMRLKKADVQLSTSNFPTPLAGLFNKHERDLFDHPGHQRVQLVHVFNPLQTELAWIGVVARDDRGRVLWEHELRSRADGAEIVQLPTAPRPVPAADTVLRPTRPSIEKREQEEE